jgi:integrase
VNRRRLPSRKGWPANLYCDDGYYSYRNPVTGKKKGLGRDKANAFSEARAANKAVASMHKSDLVAWVLGADDITLEKWIPEYKKLWKEKKKPADSTFESAERYLKRFAEQDFAKVPMRQVTTVQVAKYLDGIEANSGKGAATNMRVRLLDAFEWAISKGHISTGANPVSATIAPDYEPKRDRLSLEQFLAIKDKAGTWLANAMTLALLTGQRVSDISEMKFADVKGGYLHVAQIKSQGTVMLKLDANIRLHALGMSIGEAIKQCRDRIVSPYLVHHTRTSGTYKAGDQVSSDGISNAFSDTRDKAKIKTASGRTPATFHEIRSLAKRLYTDEYGKEFSQKILGHKSESTSAKYQDLRGSDWEIINAK